MDEKEMMKVLCKSPMPHVTETDAIIFLYDEVNEFSVNKCIKEIFDNVNKNKTLRVKTCGGSLHDTFALIDIIQEYNVNVHVDGYAYSAGFLILCSARVRTMSNNAHLMYHDLSYGMYGKRVDHENEVEFKQDLTNCMHKLITKYTRITDKQLEVIDKGKREWFLNYEEAKQLGIVTHEMVEQKITMPSQTTVLSSYEEVNVPKRTTTKTKKTTTKKQTGKKTKSTDK